MSNYRFGKWFGLLMVCAVAFATPVASHAAATVEEVEVGGVPMLKVANPAVELLVAPTRGGQVVSAVLKSGGVQFGNTGAVTAGLFSDHDSKQPHPGELMGKAYRHAVEMLADGSAKVAMAVVAEGGWRNESAPTLRGLKFEREIVLPAAPPRIDFRCRVTNTSTEPRLLDYWLQSVARIGDVGEENHYFRPTSNGISVSSTLDRSSARSFVKDIGGGWCAVVNRARRVAAFHTFDIDALGRVYNCEPAATQEFMYQTIPLPPGSSWETRLSLRVVEGVASPVFANAVLAAGAEIEFAADRYTIRHQLAAMDKPLRNWRLSTSVTDLLTQQTVQGAVVTGERIGHERAEVEVPMELAAGGTRVVTVTLEHEAGVEVYEFPFTAFGDFSPPYARNVTRRPPTLPKPDDLEALWRVARAGESAGVLVVGDSVAVQVGAATRDPVDGVFPSRMSSCFATMSSSLPTGTPRPCAILAWRC